MQSRNSYTAHSQKTSYDVERFAIDQSTGQIRAKPGVTYDFEDREEYAVTVNVSDGEDIDGEDETIPVVDASKDVIIALLDEREAGCHGARERDVR